MWAIDMRSLGLVSADQTLEGRMSGATAVAEDSLMNRRRESALDLGMTVYVECRDEIQVQLQLRNFSHRKDWIEHRWKRLVIFLLLDRARGSAPVKPT